MGKLIPFGAIPDSAVFPDGCILRLRVAKLDEVLTKEKENKAQKLMYKLSAQVVEPAAYKGLFYNENFCIGTEEDPEAELLETWQASIGGRAFKRFAKAVGIPFGEEEDSASFCNAVKGQEFLVTTVQETDDGKKDPKYKGQVRNKTTGWWKLGEKEAGLANGHDKSGSTRQTRPVGDAKPAPSDEITCASCRKRVPRKDLRAHTEAHLREQFEQGEAE
jgi:hypothetical protein